ncbi:MAG: mannitol dehydrogenase family protein [Erythrobacter sp.]|uniref:mannitol dehydrogenase family protein n=1 Tax=Erythrobacter sp. TaxID=1042 RepID=UPI00262799A1|nr:mannitol dehydrogenase family protein [Erythrobacter sp.]MDJ0978186.1 mannitol dehydrogenase family protein [Erythrobacter sp.]
MRLSPSALTQLPQDVTRFGYDRDAQSIGIVHFGIGAFHRAHQAWYTDLAMDAGDRGWAISGVSLRSAAVADQLNPQHGLYTLTERSGENAATRVIAAVREVLVAARDRDAIIARVASPDCHIVSFTVTEKGYARSGAGTLDLSLAQKSFYPLLSEALERRRGAGLPGVTLLCCDNLPDNGRTLEQLMAQWTAARAPDLDEWIAQHCTFPSSMVDRIVPRSTGEDRTWLAERLGVEDDGAIFTERFSQWVIEDRFAGPRPAWEQHGAQLVSDVAPYETAKLRMLNGAHSFLAYCGLQRGHAYVHEAMADAELGAMARSLMLEEAAPTVDAAPDQDLNGYAAELLERFRDPALRHRLDQIAMDGTQKIPQRWLDTIAWHASRGSDAPAIRQAFAAWLWHLHDGRFVDDPMGDELQALVRKGGAEAVLDRCFGCDGMRSALWQDHGKLRSWFET